MAYRITIEKYSATLGRYWTNVYQSGAATLAAASAHGLELAAAERPLYPSHIVITKVRADDNVKNTDNYKTTPLNQAGTRATQTTDSAPLFVTARVDFASADSGAPSRKYIRGTLTEDEFTWNALQASALTRLQTYADAVVASAAVDPDNADLTTGSVFPAPQMRQLKRKKRPKPTL